MILYRGHSVRLSDSSASKHLAERSSEVRVITMSSFAGSFGDEPQISDSVSTRPFGDDGYGPQLSSQPFDSSFSNFDSDLVKDSAGDSSPIFNNQSYGAEDEVFSSLPAPGTPSPPSIYSAGDGFSSFSPDQNKKGFDGGLGASDDSILPPPTEMLPEEGYARREWRRQNAIRLDEKEKREKEMLQEIIEEAQQYKVEFYRKRMLAIQNGKDSNREKEKMFLAERDKFHAEAEKNYWKTIAELIPHEVPTIEKRGRKDKEKKPSIVVIQGPKPGKPTDRSRMRHILLKLKHNPPPHMKPKPRPSSETKTDAKTSSPTSAGTNTSTSKTASAST